MCTITAQAVSVRCLCLPGSVAETPLAGLAPSPPLHPIKLTCSWLESQPYPSPMSPDSLHGSCSPNCSVIRKMQKGVNVQAHYSVRCLTITRYTEHLAFKTYVTKGPSWVSVAEINTMTKNNAGRKAFTSSYISQVTASLRGVRTKTQGRNLVSGLKKRLWKNVSYLLVSLLLICSFA